MLHQETEPIGTFGSFEELFKLAEDRPSYWEELGKLEFTEEMLARMKERGISKGQLAVRLQAKPAFITRLVSGHNNFTIETMVRVARALDCEFRCHLQPTGTKACWINVLKEAPRRAISGWALEQFEIVKSSQPECNHESIADAA